MNNHRELGYSVLCEPRKKKYLNIMIDLIIIKLPSSDRNSSVAVAMLMNHRLEIHQMALS